MTGTVSGTVLATRGRTAFALALTVLAALPALVAHYPGMADYPGHLARWAVMIDGGRDPWLVQWYAIDWHWMPNLGTDLLIRPLAALFGLEPAGRLIVIAIPLLTGLGLLAVDRALGRRVGVGTVLAFATIWSPALLMGFLNFTLSAGLALLAYALWIRAEGQGWRAPAFLLIGPLIWLCHLSGWGMLGVLVFAWEWDRAGGGIRGGVRAVPRTWPLWPPAVLSLVLGTGGPNSFVYGGGAVRDKLANWIMALADQTLALDIPLVALLVVAPLIAALRGQFDWRIGRAALLFAGLTIIMPRYLGGGDYADYRLVPIALMCWCLAIRLEGSGWLLALAAVPFLARLTLTTAAWHDNSAQTARLLTTLDHVARGARVAAAFAQDADRWRETALLHVQSYAAIRRSALVNSNFAIPGVHMLRVRGEDPAIFTDPSQIVRVAPGAPIELAQFPPAARADWLWYIGPRGPASLPRGAVVVWRADGSLLARLANRPGPR